MNISTVLLLLVAWQLLKQPRRPSPEEARPQGDFLGNILSDDTKNVIDTFGKFNDPGASGDEKIGAVLQLLTNPVFSGIAESFLGGFGGKGGTTAEKGDDRREYSQAAKDFFRPVEHIAGKEATHKLYDFYDHWYVKK